ncbi:hypothetical protein HETIRDRAFT_106763 [Heterobasidion irregulare TC 32-1]|uniref:Uncharacterized protein n=1 Tax=Heterobasidion irregulare (strain TC 32-1) TaxID=747525 RepID=W4JSX0_HETIT|nr:uncharacterized protein HETIRDRAFT_106763 [Heterobasidion irregulare TC 32-1]ETW76200.1 hypothetical protein HETIRDRAFT_106763 [Heterobasidion irregulare TC 32-1]
MTSKVAARQYPAYAYAKFGTTTDNWELRVPKVLLGRSELSNAIASRGELGIRVYAVRGQNGREKPTLCYTDGAVQFTRSGKTDVIRFDGATQLRSDAPPPRMVEDWLEVGELSSAKSTA